MKYELSKLFVAVYNDGTHYQQTPEDVSQVNPLKSAFFDVDHSKLIRFFIADKSCAWLVDLRDGHFEVNGAHFFLHNVPPLGAGDNMLKDFKLIYFRQVDQHLHSNGSQSVDVVYRLGWKATDEKGNEHERVIEIK